MTGEPPLLAGATQLNATCPLPTVPVTVVGGSGTVAGTNVFDTAEAEPVPTPFVAFTEHVYVFPFARPDTTTGLDAPLADPDTPPFDDTHDAVYPVIALPPLLAGAVNATEPDPFPRVAVPIVGAPGTVAGTKVFDAADAEPAPTAFVAFTEHV